MTLKSDLCGVASRWKDCMMSALSWSGSDASLSLLEREVVFLRLLEKSTVLELTLPSKVDRFFDTGYIGCITVVWLNNFRFRVLLV